MQRWWKNIVKDYFTFSQKERVSLLFIGLIGLGLYLFPKFYHPPKKPVNHAAFQQALSQLQITVESKPSYKRNYNSDGDEQYGYNPSRFDRRAESIKGELFEFDPNTLNEAGWKKLGVRDKTIQTIMKFTSKGFRFKQPADISRIYGLRPEEAERLMPYIRIAGKENVPHYTASFTSEPGKQYASPASTTKFTAKLIDINQADTSAFIALPGIGSKLAARIINFRDKLGGFTSINQVGETYGVPDSTFQKIKSRLTCDNPIVKLIDINKVDVSELKMHPYVRWNIANAIISYRGQHGNFKSIEDLKKIDIITDEVYNKILPYLTASN